MNTPAPITTAVIADFLRKELPECHGWQDRKLLPWVHWYQTHDRILIVTDDHDQLAGVAMGRFVEKPEEPDSKELCDRPGAPVLWIDAIVAKQPAVVPQMLRILIHKWGRPTHIAGLVFSRARELRMFPIHKLQRFFGVQST